MGTTGVQPAFVTSLAFAVKSDVDPASLMMMARQQRVAIVQAQLDTAADALDACLVQRKELSAFACKVEAFQKGNPNEGDIAPFLAKLDEGELARLRGYCTDEKGFHAERLSDAKSTDQDWEKFVSQSDEATAKLDERIEGLKSTIQELSASLDYEMKAMQRSLRGEGRTKLALAAAGGVTGCGSSATTTPPLTGPRPSPPRTGSLR